MLGTAGAATSLKSDYAAEFSVRAMLELNMNRYAEHMFTERLDTNPGGARWTTAEYDAFILAQYGSNFGSANNSNYMREKFPVLSTTDPIRPSAGSIVKPPFIARGSGTNRLLWRDQFGWNDVSSSGCGILSADTKYFTLDTRAYWAGQTDTYKYFITQPGITTATTKYVNSVWANKIVVVIENTLYEPTITVETTQDGSSWTAIKSSVAMTRAAYPDGRLSLWRNANTGTWAVGTTVTTIPTFNVANGYGKDYCAKIKGIRVTQTSSNGVMSIIEISPRVQVDISTYVSGWDVDQNLSENDSLSPVGTVSSNTATLELDNRALESDNLYTWELRRTMQAGVTGPVFMGEFAKKFAVISLDVSKSVAGAAEWVPQFIMNADTWEVSDGESAVVRLIDDITYFQSIQAPNLVMDNVSPTQAIWRILDGIGYDKVKIRRGSATEPLLDWFYCNDSQTVWDAIKSVCASHKYSVWGDAYGYINIGTASWIFNTTRGTSWSFLATSGATPADIVSHSEVIEEPLNDVVVKFVPEKSGRDTDPGQNAGIAVIKDGQTRPLYNPPSPVLLGMAEMSAACSATDTTIRIDPSALSTSNWGAFSGYALIDQEVIKYDGLRIKYINLSNITSYEVAKNATDLQEIYTRAKAGSTVTFTGQLMNVERGQFGTTPAIHTAWAAAGWSIAVNKASTVKQSRGVDPPGITLHDVRANRTPNTYLGLYKSLSGSGMNVSKFNHFATTLVLGQLTTRYVNTAGQFVSSTYAGEKIRKTYINNDDGAGIVIGAKLGANNIVTDGYYIEVRSSAKQPKEIAIVPITAGKLIRSSQVLGDAVYRPGSAIDLTVVVTSGHKIGTTRYTYIDAYVNHFLSARMKLTDSVYQAKMSSNSTKTQNVALMVSGPTHATFGWFAASNPGVSTSETMHNGAEGHRSRLIGQLFKWQKTSFTNVPFYYEPFDNKVREILVQDIRFTKTPALTVKWYPVVNEPRTDKSTNGRWIARSYDVASELTDISPYGARIAIGNISNRGSVVLSEDGGTTYPFIYGQVVERIEAEQTVTKKRLDAIRQQGDKKYEASPEWITNTKAATTLAEWILDNCSDGVRRHTMSVYSNHLIEIGDLVTVDYPAKGITTSLKFVIRSIKKSWSNGLDTEVELVEL